MSTWVEFTYREFFDIPRAVVLRYRDQLYFFDSAFDEDRDDYSDTYMVYRLPVELAPLLDSIPWTDLQHHGVAVGMVPTTSVMFDPTKRQAIDSEVLERLDRHG